MKLTVTGCYVDLDFGTVTPIRLSQKFAQESIAQSAASAIAVQIGIQEYAVYSAQTQETKTVKVAVKARKDAPSKRSERVRRRHARHA